MRIDLSNKKKRNEYRKLGVIPCIVYLDGVAVEDAFAFDADAGYVDRYKRVNGEIQVIGKGSEKRLAHETLNGKVTYEPINQISN